MNNDRQSPESDDQDLARLFDAQQTTVPEALDRLILAAAKDAVDESAPTGQKRINTAAVKGWFAVAASLLLCVLLAPLLLQSPESALDDSAANSVTSPVMPGIQTRSRSTVATDEAMTQSKMLAEDTRYRHTPENWVQRIRRLEKDGLVDEAQTEYRLFRKQHPDYQPDFVLNAKPE